MNLDPDNYWALAQQQTSFSTDPRGTIQASASQINWSLTGQTWTLSAQANYMADVNASSETVYPVKNGNSMNKKLEAAKKWLKERGR